MDPPKHVFVQQYGLAEHLVQSYEKFKLYADFQDEITSNTFSEYTLLVWQGNKELPPYDISTETYDEFYTKAGVWEIFKPKPGRPVELVLPDFERCILNKLWGTVAFN